MNWYFIAWMIMYPVSVSVCQYIDRVKNPDMDKYSDGVKAAAAAVNIALWLGIGYSLFN